MPTIHVAIMKFISASRQLLNWDRYKASRAMIFLLLAMAGCAQKDQVNTYSPGGLQQANKVDRAVVKSVRQIDVDDPSLGLGTAAGAAAGGITGSQIGAAGGNAFATLGGVLIGGAIGYLVDQNMNADTAYEYILEKKNGDLMTLAEKQDRPFLLGCNVLILYGVQARVIPDITGQDVKHLLPACFADPANAPSL